MTIDYFTFAAYLARMEARRVKGEEGMAQSDPATPDNEDDDPDDDPEDEHHCPSGCGRTMERIRLHKGTPETGYTALQCNRCGRFEC